MEAVGIVFSGDKHLVCWVLVCMVPAGVFGGYCCVVLLYCCLVGVVV